MTLSGTMQRSLRLVSSTCLSAGLALCVFASAARAQTLPADYSGTPATTDGTTVTDPMVAAVVVPPFVRATV